MDNLFSLDAVSPGALAAILAVGVAAGFLNVVAGGGSLLAMPVLIFAGLPETVANGTIRLAILAQNAVAVLRYHRAGRIDIALVRALVPPILVGAAIGAAAGTLIPDSGFRVILGSVMLASAVAVIVGPTRLTGHRETGPPITRPWVVWPVFLIVGFYGGLIQVAVGYLLLAVLTLVVGLGLVEANVIKVVLVLAYTPLAIGIFLGGDKINLWLGLVLAVGHSVGAWIGAGCTLERGVNFIRVVLALTVVLVGVKLLGFIG